MKLTNAIRDRIVEKAIASTDIPKRREKLKLELKAFAKKLATEGLPEPVPAPILKIWADKEQRIACARYIKTSSSVVIVDMFATFGRYKHAFMDRDDRSYDGDLLPAKLTLDDPFPCENVAPEVSLHSHQFEAEAIELVKFHRKTNTMECDLIAGIRAIVKGANTKAQLLKAWPEGEKFLPIEVAKARTVALLPVETILEVNRKLGLSK